MPHDVKSRMHYRTRIALAAVVVALLALCFGPRILERDGVDTVATSPPSTQRSSARESPAANARPSAVAVGFTSQRALAEHFEKHGREFGSITRDDYLRRAQALRDARAGGEILEAVRDDGVITRFDVKTGDYIAFHDNHSIRTFFKPSDGRRYFEKQIDRRRE